MNRNKNKNKNIFILKIKNNPPFIVIKLLEGVWKRIEKFRGGLITISPFQGLYIKCFV